ncbi:hypothetical protein HU200_051109 [Digitaria exilis]|uniref:Uncharacterized protein n=1 Tax=Digitaria exilis TaxID=1010633 RepID=A0A835E8F9_9POAL|nr:hypothetical protein HU200_051109 [Digitaria exilis]
MNYFLAILARRLGYHGGDPSGAGGLHDLLHFCMSRSKLLPVLSFISHNQLTSSLPQSADRSPCSLDCSSAPAAVPTPAATSPVPPLLAAAAPASLSSSSSPGPHDHYSMAAIAEPASTPDRRLSPAAPPFFPSVGRGKALRWADGSPASEASYREALRHPPSPRAPAPPTPPTPRPALLPTAVWCNAAAGLSSCTASLFAGMGRGSANAGDPLHRAAQAVSKRVAASTVSRRTIFSGSAAFPRVAFGAVAFGIPLPQVVLRAGVTSVLAGPPPCHRVRMLGAGHLRCHHRCRLRRMVLEGSPPTSLRTGTIRCLAGAFVTGGMLVAKVAVVSVIRRRRRLPLALALALVTREAEADKTAKAVSSSGDKAIVELDCLRYSVHVSSTSEIPRRILCGLRASFEFVAGNSRLPARPRGQQLRLLSAPTCDGQRWVSGRGGGDGKASPHSCWTLGKLPRGPARLRGPTPTRKTPNQATKAAQLTSVAALGSAGCVCSPSTEAAMAASSAFLAGITLATRSPLLGNLPANAWTLLPPVPPAETARRRRSNRLAKDSLNMTVRPSKKGDVLAMKKLGFINGRGTSTPTGHERILDLLPAASVLTDEEMLVAVQQAAKMIGGSDLRRPDELAREDVRTWWNHRPAHRPSLRLSACARAHTHAFAGNIQRGCRCCTNRNNGLIDCHPAYPPIALLRYSHAALSLFSFTPQSLTERGQPALNAKTSKKARTMHEVDNHVRWRRPTLEEIDRSTTLHGPSGISHRLGRSHKTIPTPAERTPTSAPFGETFGPESPL